jgi:hypothetical protein
MAEDRPAGRSRADDAEPTDDRADAPASAPADGTADDAGADGDAGGSAGSAGSDGSDGPGTTALSDEDIRDALPADLDAAGYVGPYLFPNNNRRRIPAVIYWVTAAACGLAWFLTRNGEPVLVNEGILFAGVALALFGTYSWVSGWNLDVDERDALVVAVGQVGFPVGHASAQMGWRGALSRPTWRILLYSAEDPPTRRGLVLVDGIDAEVVEWFVEENPEAWDDAPGPVDD